MWGGAVCKILEFGSQNLANTVWAFATLEVHDKELLDAVRGGTVCKIWDNSLRELFEGVRPPAQEDRSETEPGEWIHGWEFYASSTRGETFYRREHPWMPDMSRASRATLRSESGPQAAAWLTAVPTSLAITISPVLFQIYLRRRLRLPLLRSNRRCEGCRATLDGLGDHRAACSVSGRLRRRAKPIKLAWSAVIAEVGAVVADQVLLRDTNLPVASGDSRQLDFVA